MKDLTQKTEQVIAAAETNNNVVDASEPVAAPYSSDFKYEPVEAKPMPGNTLMNPEQQSGFHPEVEIVKDKTGKTPPDRLQNIKEKLMPGTKVARPATELDLAVLDESMIMDLPFIKSVDFNLPAELFKKPKDANIRFRWVNYKNAEGANLNFFQSIGFENALLEDVDLKATPVSANMIDGTMIKWYDVLLMKINVLVLMGRYKRNQQSALRNVGRFSEQAQAEADRQFNADLSNKGILHAFNKLREAGHKVEFYVPGAEEKSTEQSHVR